MVVVLKESGPSFFFGRNNSLGSEYWWGNVLALSEFSNVFWDYRKGVLEWIGLKSGV